MSPIFQKKPDNLQAEIDRLHEHIKTLEWDSDEFNTAYRQLAALYEIKHARVALTRIDMDTLVAVGGNLLGILTIVNHERLNVVTSKALGLLWKIR